MNKKKIIQVGVFIVIFLSTILAFMMANQKQTLDNRSSAAPNCITTIQSLVDMAPPGGKVTVPACVYRESVYITKPLTLSAEPGTILEGDSRNTWFTVAANDVTIEGFEMRGTSNARYWGAITQNVNDVAYDRLTVQNNTLIGASYAAVATKLGTGHKILNNEFVDNGALGIRIDSGQGHVISGNRVYNTNLDGVWDTGWEAGGIKVSGNYGGVKDMIIEKNEMYGNNGHGIWIDVDGRDIVIRENRVYKNTRNGITYELSFGGKIYENKVWENGYGYDAWGWGGGIMVQNSSDVEVYDNILAWNADGIAVISQDRGEVRWNAVSGNHIHDNAIIHQDGADSYALGWFEDWSGPLNLPASNNRGSNNKYWYANPESGDALRFKWTWLNYGYGRLSDFNNTPGESNGSYISQSDKSTLLVQNNMPAYRGAVIQQPSPTTTTQISVTAVPTTKPTEVVIIRPSNTPTPTRITTSTPIPIALPTNTPTTIPTRTPTPSYQPQATSTPVQYQSPAQTQYFVESLTLINADTNQPISIINDGAEIDSAKLPTTKLNIRANTIPSVVGSVKFGWNTNANAFTDNTAPYAFAGDTNSNYHAWTPYVGSHTITATAYSLANAQGNSGNTRTVSFKVVNSNQASPTPKAQEPAKAKRESIWTRLLRRFGFIR